MGIAKKDTKVWHLNYGYLLRFCVTDVKGTREKPPPGEMDGLITQYMRWALVDKAKESRKKKEKKLRSRYFPSFFLVPLLLLSFFFYFFLCEIMHALNLSWVYKKSSCWWGFGC